jgi:hypothetical protein
VSVPSSACAALILGASACADLVGFDKISYLDGGGDAGFPGDPQPWDGALPGDAGPSALRSVPRQGGAATDGSSDGVDAGAAAICGAGDNVGTIGVGNSMVHVGVYVGRGSVDVFRNGQWVGTTSGVGAFRFNIGDTYAFSAMPCPGFSFKIFCGDIPACTLHTTDIQFTGIITATEGIVYAEFQQ